MKRRRFLSGSPNHVYQRSLNGSVIFYSLEDCLVYFTVFCTSAVKYGVSVLGLCVMYDHIHQLLEAPDLRTLSTFERMVNLKFSYEYFEDLRQKVHDSQLDGQQCAARCATPIPNSGHLFRSPFRSAPKVGGKAVRTCIAYLYSNPVERHIHEEAIK